MMMMMMMVVEVLVGALAAHLELVVDAQGNQTSSHMVGMSAKAEAMSMKANG